MRKLTTIQSENYTTGDLLDYDYIKNHYKIIAIDMSRQKELDADPKAIKQIEFAEKLKNLDKSGNPAAPGNDQSMFILTISEKIKETRLGFFEGSVRVM